MNDILSSRSAMSRGEVAGAFRSSGVAPGDVVLFHSSLKSIGERLEDGPLTLIDGILDAASPGGTVAVPTLWYHGNPEERREQDFDLRESPAWNGAVAEAMRRDPRALRSRHFTHSVSAIGPGAESLTRNHGEGRPAPSPWSETAFAESSPWSRLYEIDAWYAFVGVGMNTCTMKHWIESRFVLGELQGLPPDLRRECRSRLAHERVPGPWPYYDGDRMEPLLDRRGVVRRTRLGRAEVMVLRTRPLVDHTLRILQEDPWDWFRDDFLQWLDEVRRRSGRPGRGTTTSGNAGRDGVP